MNISVNLGSIKLSNPTVLASGIMGTSKASLLYVAQNGAGALTIKSISVEERKGHPAPIMITFEGGMLNSVGYSNPGIDNIEDEFGDLSDIPVPTIGSITGKNQAEFEILAEKISAMNFDALEVVLSCPHTPGYGTMAGLNTPHITEKITKEVKKRYHKPVFIKLSPNIMALSEVAKAAEAGGADGITAVNTAGPGMMIDIACRKPILGGIIGGLSGDGLRPIAIRCVYDIYKAVKIPIIGTGGVSTGQHILEMIMAGATAVGIGTAVYNRGIDVFKKATLELKELMEKFSITSLDQIRGAAHET